MSQSTQYLVYLMVFCAGFLALQVLISAGKQAALTVSLANDRLRRMSEENSQTKVLSEIKRARGINDENQIRTFMKWIGKLVLQSGLPLGAYGIYCAMAGLALLGFVFFAIWKSSFMWGFMGAGLGVFVPIFVLRYLVKRRRNKAIVQLPEALDVIIRSLGAGHPVPVAMSLVAREMPDPIGSEFGIASDEVAYGSSISAAIQRLADRVGHEDFELFSAMIRLQEKTGGNLAELLASNSKTIRDRQRMRLKIKAASAEGRMSAIILNVAPILMVIGVNKMAPDFYGDVKDSPILTYALWGAFIWMIIGNLIMRKMINFKI